MVSMYSSSKIVGFICIVLTIIMWAVTLTTDLTAESIGTAVFLTAIVAATAMLGLR